MRYVKTADISIGNRFAKTIYNRDGVLLFASGVKVEDATLKKIQQLDLYGTYILDPAEPVPPITYEELEFERFQWAQTYVVNDILKGVLKGKRLQKLNELVDLIYSRYGSDSEKMIFNQCLRGENDFISKHSLNVAVLSARLAKKLKMDEKEIKYLIEAAIFHDIGRLLVPPEILHKEEPLTPQELNTVHKCLLEGFRILSANYGYPAGVRRYIIQLSKELGNKLPNCLRVEQTLLPGTQILQVADIYDTLTAVRPYKSPMSAFSALKIIRNEKDKYSQRITDVLEECIHILPCGAYVMLSNGEQGIVVTENSRAIDRPVVLGLRSNKLFDLSVANTYKEIRILDTVFTPDNRQHMEIDVSQFIK